MGGLFYFEIYFILLFYFKKVKIFLKNFRCSRRIFPIYLIFFIQVYNFISADLQILRRRSDKIDEMHNRYKRIVLVFVFSKKFWVNHIKLRSIEILDLCICKTVTVNFRDTKQRNLKNVEQVVIKL